MRKMIGISAMFLLVLVSSQPVFCEQKVEFSPSASGSFSPRTQPARIVGAAQSVSPASYQKIGVVSVCEKINLPDQLKKEKIEKMVMALREHAAKQGGDIVRQNEDVKKEAILKSRSVTIEDPKVVGETGPIDILCVVCKSKAELKQEAKEAAESATVASEDPEHAGASECIKAEVWRAIER
jgi:hypothetical protein